MYPFKVPCDLNVLLFFQNAMIIATVTGLLTKPHVTTMNAFVILDLLLIRGTVYVWQVK